MMTTLFNQYKTGNQTQRDALKVYASAAAYTWSTHGPWAEKNRYECLTSKGSLEVDLSNFSSPNWWRLDGMKDVEFTLVKGDLMSAIVRKTYAQNNEQKISLYQLIPHVSGLVYNANKSAMIPAYERVSTENNTLILKQNVENKKATA
jgi:hypothetical protein